VGERERQLPSLGPPNSVQSINDKLFWTFTNPIKRKKIEIIKKNKVNKTNHLTKLEKVQKKEKPYDHPSLALVLE
jgi:hypothetical protein